MIDIEQKTMAAIKKATPAVVSIVMSKLMAVARDNPLGAFFGPSDQFGIPLPDQETNGTIHLNNTDKKEMTKVGGGSGFIVDANGLILTNKHVVFDADAEYTVITNDGKEYTGKVISRDPINDVAMLKIDAHKLPTIALTDSNNIQIGQTAIAIGNALGLFSNSVSKGIISGLGRKISASLGSEGSMEHLRNVIQTDVAINQGNSGGPLINLDAEVVGINTAVIYGAQNIGFAIPINLAHKDLEDIRTKGRIVKPYLGLRYIILNKELKDRYALACDYGALVVRDHIPGSEAIIKGSPAHKAGIKENDIILSVNNKDINEQNDIMDCLQTYEVGDELDLEVLRKDKKLALKTTLEERK